MQPMPNPQPQPHMHMPVVTHDITDLQRKVSKAKSLLILDHPFFGMAVSKRPIIYTERVDTAAMAATGQMYLNPVWCNTLTVRQLMFLLAHEALHYMLSHSLRMGTRLPTAWNISCDKVINDTLLDAGVGDPILDGIFMDGAREFSAEQLYDPADEDGDGPGRLTKGIGNDVCPPVGDDGLPLDDTDIREIETQVKLDTIQAAKAAENVGKLPGSIKRLVDELVNVSTPWHEILERYFVGKIRSDITWKRLKKRFVSQGIHLPSHSSVPTAGTLAIIIDASGSVTNKEFDEYNSHVNRILHTCNPSLLHVIYCDTSVRNHEEYTVDDLPITIKTQAGGGTAFKPAFDYIADEDLDPDVVVYLTDGHASTNFPQPSYDVVWLTTGSTDLAWGTVIEFKE